MSYPPPDESTPSRYSDNPTAREINRVAIALDSYARQQQTTETKTAKHNRKVRRWTRTATIGALVYTIITTLVLIASIRSIQEARRATHAAIRAVEVASQQVEAARVANTINETNLLTQQRPWVAIDNPKFGSFGWGNSAY